MAIFAVQTIHYHADSPCIVAAMQRATAAYIPQADDGDTSHIKENSHVKPQIASMPVLYAVCHTDAEA